MSNIEEMLGQVIAMMAEDKSNDWSDEIDTIETAIEEIKAYQGRLVIDLEKMRDFLESAWWSGFDCSEHGTDEFFYDWYLDNYDDIIEEGTESPAGEKVSEKEKITIENGFGNEIREVEIPPYFSESRRLF
jgi:hypothetical protein